MAGIRDLVGVDIDDDLVRSSAALAREDAAFLRDLVASRQRKGINQGDLARLIGISQSTISEFERDGGDPRLSTIRRYALAIGSSYFHIVDDRPVKIAKSVTFDIEPPPAQVDFGAEEAETWEEFGPTVRMKAQHG